MSTPARPDRQSRRIDIVATITLAQALHAVLGPDEAPAGNATPS